MGVCSRLYPCICSLYRRRFLSGFARPCQKILDPFLDNGFVSSIEYVPSRKSLILNQTTGDGKRKQDVTCSGLGIQAAIIGGERTRPSSKSFLDYYNSNSFMLEDGKLNQTWPLAHVKTWKTVDSVIEI